MNTPIDPYDVLEVSSSASEEEIKHAYRRLVKLYHPDRTNGNDTKFKEVGEAYSLIGAPAKRAAYDAAIAEAWALQQQKEAERAEREAAFEAAFGGTFGTGPAASPEETKPEWPEESAPKPPRTPTPPPPPTPPTPPAVAVSTYQIPIRKGWRWVVAFVVLVVVIIATKGSRNSSNGTLSGGTSVPAATTNGIAPERASYTCGSYTYNSSGYDYGPASHPAEYPVPNVPYRISLYSAPYGREDVVWILARTNRDGSMAWCRVISAEAQDGGPEPADGLKIGLHGHGQSLTVSIPYAPVDEHECHLLLKIKSADGILEQASATGITGAEEFEPCKVSRLKEEDENTADVNRMLEEQPED